MTLKNCFIKYGFNLFDSDISTESDIEDYITLAFLFPNFNLSNLDLYPYSLYGNNDLITENFSVSIIDCIDKVTETCDEVESENEEMQLAFQGEASDPDND